MNRLQKNILISLAAVCILAGLAWGGRKAYKGATERRLLADSAKFSEKQDWRNASLSLQRALQINPLSFEATKGMADLLDTVGVPYAVAWRVRVYEMKPDQLDLRFDWARTALRFRDVKGATEAMAGLPANANTNLVFHQLAGGLEAYKGNEAAAMRHFNEALKMQPTNKVVAMNLASVGLASTNAVESRRAREALLALAEAPEMRRIALSRLSADAVSRQAFPDALRFSGMLVADAGATFETRLDQLRLLRKAKDPAFNATYVRLRDEASKNALSAYLLARWMALTVGPDETLKWLKTLPDDVRTNQPVPMVTADCLVLAKNWRGLIDTAKREDWGDMEYFRHALLSVAQKSLALPAESKASWNRARAGSRQKLERLIRLSQTAESFGWADEHVEVLSDIAFGFPQEVWAVDSLVRNLYKLERTRSIHSVLIKAHATRPDDPMTKNNLAYVSLLLGLDLERAHRLAAEAYAALPNDPTTASTFGFSLIQQDRISEAQAVLAKTGSAHLSSPSISACIGLLNAKLGNRQTALERLKQAEAARLLPEERRLVVAAKAGL